MSTESQGCECKDGWICGRCKDDVGRNGFAWIETRYQGLDTDEQG